MTRAPRFLGPDAPPAPELRKPVSLRWIAKRYGKRYADQVKTLRTITDPKVTHDPARNPQGDT